MLVNETELKRRDNSTSSNFHGFLQMQIYNDRLCCRRIFTTHEF